MDESIKACPESVFCGGRTRSNIILYCRHFEKTVSFYQEVLGLAVHHRKVWLVEFRLSGDAFVSVADARRASIESASGAGVTLSLAVGAIDEAHARLRQKKDIPLRHHDRVGRAGLLPI